MTDPYRENAAPEVVTKIVRTLEVKGSAFLFVLALVLGAVVLGGIGVPLYRWAKAPADPAVPECVETVEIIGTTDSARKCPGGRIHTEKTGDYTMLVKCTCDAPAAPAPEPTEAGAR